MREKVIVSTDFVLKHLRDSNVRVVEVSEDVLLYHDWHVPGAVQVVWERDAQRQDVRDVVDRRGFERLMSRLGISNDTTVVLYGDKANWWACYFFWLMKYYGHRDVRIMDGGRKRWEMEGKPKSKEVPTYPPTRYVASPPDEDVRAYAQDILQRLLLGEDFALVDVRSPDEYSGRLLHMPDYPQEGAQRGGHIPGAINVPWSLNVNEDWTFKGEEELRKLYEGRGITPDREIITYCRIGERSALTWFVLKYLLGYPEVRNYDGSWTEWGNMVRVPIRRGEEP